MPRPRPPVPPLLRRRPDPVALARRVATGIGLREIRVLEARLGQVEEQLAENAALARPLAEQVRHLEASLVPLLEARARAVDKAAESERARRAAG